METRQFVRNTAITLLAPILFYGVAFAWETIYHQTRFEIWGLPPSLFPLSPQLTYLEAIMPASTAATAPVTWADTVFGSWLSVLFFCAIGAAMLAAYLYTGSWLEQRTESRRPTPRKFSPTEKRMIRWASWPFWIFTGPMALALTVSLVLVLLLAPPYLAARRDGEHAWVKKEYLVWPEATWTDESGQTRTGYLAACSSPWCGIVNADGAEVIEAAKIKRIAKKRSSPSPSASP